MNLWHCIFSANGNSPQYEENIIVQMSFFPEVYGVDVKLIGFFLTLTFQIISRNGHSLSQHRTVLYNFVLILTKHKTSNIPYPIRVLFVSSKYLFQSFFQARQSTWPVTLDTFVKPSSRLGKSLSTCAVNTQTTTSCPGERSWF